MKYFDVAAGRKIVDAFATLGIQRGVLSYSLFSCFLARSDRLLKGFTFKLAV